MTDEVFTTRVKLAFRLKLSIDNTHFVYDRICNNAFPRNKIHIWEHFQDHPVGSVTLTTKFGQQYQCSYPNQAEENAKQKEEEKEAEEIGIVELLKPMETGPCLLHVKKIFYILDSRLSNMIYNFKGKE